MSETNPISFSKLIDALMDESTPFHPRYLNRFSDLEPNDIALLAETWPKVSVRRREALLEDLEEIHMADDLLWFEGIGRLALKDSEPGVRIRAIRILREYELADLLSTFMDVAEHDPDINVRADATIALGTYIYMGEVEDISPAKLQRVEEFLLGLLSSDDSKLVRRRALEAMGYSSREEMIGLIDNAYSSNDTDWLVSALYAMGRSANSHWNSKVLKMLTHKSPAVRAEAAGAAGELEIKASVPVLLELLRDTDLDVRLASIWALSQVGGEGVRRALEILLEASDDDEEANQIEKALENLDFTEEMQDLALFEVPDDGKDGNFSSVDDIDNDLDDIFTEDDEA